MFSQPNIKKLLSQFALVKLYTDKVPNKYQPTTSAEENRKLRDEKFNAYQLPFYVILNSKGTEVRRFDGGKITEVGKFVEFLENNQGQRVAAR